MQITINIEKKHFYIITSILLIGLIGFATALYSDGTSPYKPAIFHYLKDIVYNDNGDSVDADLDGIIDEANHSHFADSALFSNQAGNADKIDNLDSTALCKSDGSNCPAGGKWSDTAGGIYYNDGNTGIGTDSPDSKLQVAGTVYSSVGGFKFPDGTIQTTAASSGSAVNDNSFQCTYRTTSITSGTGDSVCAAYGEKCVDMHRFDNGADSWCSRYWSGYLHLYTIKCCEGGDKWDESGNNIYRSSGNVGIGTINPGAKLDVVGAIKGTQLCIDTDCKSSWPTSGLGIGDTAPYSTSCTEYGTTVNMGGQIGLVNIMVSQTSSRLFLAYSGSSAIINQAGSTVNCKRGYYGNNLWSPCCCYISGSGQSQTCWDAIQI